MIDHPPAGNGTSKSPELPLFRFGLRQMFGFVAASCMLLTGMVLAGGVTALAILLAVLVVSLHVLGTALGTALRARSDRRASAQIEMGVKHRDVQRQSVHPAALPPSPTASAVSLPPRYLAASTHLPGRRKLVAVGAAIGAAGGGLFLMFAIGPRENLPGLVVGTLSLAVLGGWFAFLVSSFYAILRHGLRDAATHSDP